jgi:flagellar motor switch protein FliN/FliY
VIKINPRVWNCKPLDKAGSEVMESVEVLDFSQVEESTEKVKPFWDGGNLDIIRNVKVKVEVRVGEAELTVDELLNLGRDSIVQLKRLAMEPVDLLIDGKVVARGQLVAAEDNFGIRITELDS